MFRSLMNIIRELYLCLTKVMFVLKQSVKLHRYIYLVMWQHVVEWHVCCVYSQSHSALHKTDTQLDSNLTLHSTQHTCS